MSRRVSQCLFCLLAICLSGGGARADQDFLQADFNDKAIDQTIGTGGAALGEPVLVDRAIATVRNGPMGSPCLEISDDSPEGWEGVVQFDLLEDQSLTSGPVIVAADFWFETVASAGECVVKVLERGVIHKRFTELLFEDNGDIYLHYGDASSAGVIGQAATGRAFRMIQAFDMDARTVDVWLDGVAVVEDLPFGVADAGIGTVTIGTGPDVDLQGSFLVDAVTVTDYFQATPSLQTTWGRIRAIYR